MKRFLVYTGIFFLPILIFGVTAEILLRQIPNEYRFKNNYLNKYSDSIEVLFLGSSHAYFGINPEFAKEKSFNAAHISQSFDLDLAILKKYEQNWRNLRVIALPLSYFSLNTHLKNSIEDWRIKYYTLYYGINSTSRMTDHFELFNNKLAINLSRIYSYYIEKQKVITCNSLGWGTAYTSKGKLNLIQTGKSAAKRNTKMDKSIFAENMEALNDIVDFAKKKNVRVLIYTPPAFITYVALLEKNQLDQAVKTGILLHNENSNVTYINLMNDPTFAEIDYFDAHHVNEIGAKKLTLKIDSIISRLK